MKKALCAALALSVGLISAPVLAEESDKIRVIVDNNEVSFDAQPFIESSRVLVPFRAIFEALGCGVTFFDETKTVVANKGDKYISLTINSTEIYSDGEAGQLEVAPKIVNDRTFVPIRAISEGVDAVASWNDEIKTVFVESKQGQHFVTTKKLEKIVKNADGTEVVNLSYYYPQISIEDKDAYIESLNKQFEQDAVSFIDEQEKEWTDIANDEYETMFKGTEKVFVPYEISHSFEVTTDRNDVLSITGTDYYDLHGAHPSTMKLSAVYDLKNEKTLALTDILMGSDEEIEKLAVDSFNAEIDKTEGFFDDAKETVEKEKKNIKFYLTDNSLVMYFNVYDIAPYVMGYPEVEIPFDAQKFKLLLENANLDTLRVSLDGNATTGYSWQRINADTDRIAVSEPEYVQSETGALGAGGTYNFDVTGAKPGRCTLTFAYARIWEGGGEMAKEVKYTLYVSKDGKITILSKAENDL